MTDIKAKLFTASILLAIPACFPPPNPCVDGALNDNLTPEQLSSCELCGDAITPLDEQDACDMDETTGEEPPPQDGPWLCSNAPIGPSHRQDWRLCISMTSGYSPEIAANLELHGGNPVIRQTCNPLYTLQQSFDLDTDDGYTVLMTVCAENDADVHGVVDGGVALHWKSGPGEQRFDLHEQWGSVIAPADADWTMMCPVSSTLWCKGGQGVELGDDCSCSCDMDSDCNGEMFGELICDGAFAEGFCDSNQNP